MNLEVSFMLLESSIMLLEKIYSTGITQDDRHLRLSYFTVQATGQTCIHKTYFDNLIISFKIGVP